MLLDGIFRSPVFAVETPLSAEFPNLFPEEERAISGAIARRRREFAAGRSCARRAMKAFGLANSPIIMGADRAPIWPRGITGSISHSATRCVAAVGRHSDGIRAVGIDIEEAVPLEEGLAEEICIASERNWLLTQQSSMRGLLQTMIFCTKECVYKCQYPLSSTLFGFDAIRIELDLAEEKFAAYFETDVAPFKTGERLNGRIGFRQGHVVSGMVIG